MLTNLGVFFKEIDFNSLSLLKKIISFVYFISIFNIMNIINYIEHLNAISIQSISNIIYMYQSLDSSIYFFKRSVNENNETLSGFFLSRTSTLKLLQSYGDNTLNIEIKVGF